MATQRFNLLHLVSDWFRNPRFRGRFVKLNAAGRIALMKDEYDLSPTELAIVVNHLRAEGANLIADAAGTANYERPERWEGVTSAQFSAKDPVYPKGTGPGWPGSAWRCLEDVTPKTVKAGRKVKLKFFAWNVRTTDSIELQTLVPSKKVVQVPFTVQTDKNGRSTLTGEVTLDRKATWTVVLKIDGAPETAGSLPLAIKSE